MTGIKPARNYQVLDDGYVSARYLCENAPTNRVRPKSLLDGHTYESFGIGNAAGWRWLPYLRTVKCVKCGGRVIPINKWIQKEFGNEAAY